MGFFLNSNEHILCKQCLWFSCLDRHVGGLNCNHHWLVQWTTHSIVLITYYSCFDDVQSIIPVLFENCVLTASKHTIPIQCPDSKTLGSNSGQPLFTFLNHIYSIFFQCGVTKLLNYNFVYYYVTITTAATIASI